MKGDSIHVWVPGIQEGAGGIQAFSRVYVQALFDAYPHARIRVFVKNDKPAEDDPLRRLGVSICSVAGVPSWLRSFALVLAGLVLGIRENPRCAITTHLHFLPALRILGWLRGVKFVAILHGIEAWDLRNGWCVRAMRAAHHLTAVSRHTRQVVMDAYGIDPAKIRVVPNTFDTERFGIGPKPENLLRRYGLKPSQPVVLTVSRLAFKERYKGHRQVLAAMGVLRQAFPEVTYLIVGTGDDLPALRQLTSDLGLEKNVIFAGQVPGEELPDHYRLCDVFAMPSSREGFGIVFLEAMACGKPVVAGNADGSVDALDGGRLGELVDPADSGQIAAAIRRCLKREPAEALWHDPERLRREVAAQFSYARVSRLLTDDLSGILGIVQRGGVEDEGRRRPAVGGAGLPQIVVLTQLTSPYQVEFFNALASTGGCQLKVVYLTSKVHDRQWAVPQITHDHLILSEAPQMRKEALSALMDADLAVFNYYTDWFALQAIRERASRRRPWVFWGERPGFFQTGLIGVLGRWLLLMPLHRHAAPIWAVGRFGVQGYQHEFGHARSYQNIPYFSNLQRFFSVPRSPGEPRVFMYSGSLLARKGVDLLAEAFARLAQRHPHARLVLLGSGDLEARMRVILEPCASQVTWLGFRPWEDLPKCYAMGSVFCFPSRYDGWGLALVEALAAGMPAIGTTRAGAAIEFLSDKTAGWLVEPGNSQALEKAMEEALEMPEEEFVRMGRAARKLVAGSDLAEGVQRFIAASQDVLTHWEERTPVGAGKT